MDRLNDRMLRGAMCLMLFCLICQAAPAQDEWPLQQVDKTAGLSNSAITTIYMDSHDHVWFGSWDGLNLYDGDRITTYKPVTGDPHSISNNIIRQILEDREGNLWFVTHDGINRYDRKLDIFHRYLDQVDHLPFLENNLKATLSGDSSLLISMAGWGVGYYSDQEDAFVPVLPQGKPLKDIREPGMHDGFLYLVNSRGELRSYTRHHDPVETYTIERPQFFSFRTFLTLDDRYFLIFQKDRHTLKLIELDGGRILRSSELDIHDALVTCIAPGIDHSRFYMGTDEGEVFQVALASDGFEVKSLTPFLPTLRQKRLKIFSIHESEQNILWVGTDGDGVYKYLTKERAFYSLGEGDTSEGKLSNNIVRAIYMAEDGSLYVGTRSGGLNVLDPAFRHTRVYNKLNGLSDNTVLAITEGPRGNIWMGLDGEGIDMLEEGTGRILHFPRDFASQPEALHFGSVYKVFFDSYGHLWLGTSGYGVIYMKIEKDRKGNYHLRDTYSILPAPHDDTSLTIKSNIVYSIAEEEPNILWFGTRSGGLYRYNTLTRQFTHNLQAESNSRYALSNNDILSLYIDREDKLWVGTSGGLNKVNLNTFSVVQYTQNDGLANNTIHGILEDRYGRLWLSSNNGLFVFAPRNNAFKNFNWNDGLRNYEYTDGAYFQAAGDDRLFFGGTKGLDIVVPSKTDTSATFSRLTLTDLFISNVLISPLDSTGILQSSIDLQERIILRYDQNFLSFRFTTLDYWHKQRCNYRYYMENFDEDWVYIGNESAINLTNIPPGEYVLHLNNTNENGDWNPRERTLSITITPPFWATNMAYFIYVLLALLAQAGLIQFLRKRAKRRKASEIERLKKQQADIIQKYKLEFFTDIAHEFRTPLTLILGPAASLLEKTQNNPALHHSLQSIYRNSLRLQKLIQELIQFRKVELGKEKLRIRRLDIIAFVEEILQSFRQYALEKEITLAYEMSEHEIFCHADSDIVEKIMINLLSNALKYTEQGGRVSVKVWQERQRVCFTVRDNGIGIHPHELSRIFDRFTHLQEERTTNSVGIGLSLTNKLISLHKGEIMVESTPGKGSSFTFWLPCLPDRQAADLSTYHGVLAEPHDDFVLNKLEEHVQAEFYHKDHLDREMINISLERFDHTILIVDDNLQILNLLRDLLSNKYNIISCTRGAEALTVLSNRRIDLVISDVIMPEMDGYTLCTAIKDKIETSHIPVILLTAKGEIEERIEGLQAGADAYIPKPFHPEHLYVRIKKLISTRELLKKKFEAYSVSENEFSSLGIGAKDDEFFRKLDHFIKQEMENTHLDAQHIANHLGMSKTSLYKKIRTLTGQTPHALINHYRLKKAAYLLTNSDYNVSEIIYMTGFNSRSYFYKSFQEMYHCPPSSYGKESS